MDTEVFFIFWLVWLTLQWTWKCRYPPAFNSLGYIPRAGIGRSYNSCWRRQWHPTPVLLPGKSHGRRSLIGCRPWGREESDTTERLHFHFSLSCIGGGNGNPLQCYCLENPRNGGAWWAAIYGVTQSRIQLKRFSSIIVVYLTMWGHVILLCFPLLLHYFTEPPTVYKIPVSQMLISTFFFF